MAGWRQRQGNTRARGAPTHVAATALSIASVDWNAVDLPLVAVAVVGGTSSCDERERGARNGLTRLSASLDNACATCAHRVLSTVVAAIGFAVVGAADDDDGCERVAVLADVVGAVVVGCEAARNVRAEVNDVASGGGDGRFVGAALADAVVVVALVADPVRRSEASDVEPALKRLRGACCRCHAASAASRALNLSLTPVRSTCSACSPSPSSLLSSTTTARSRFELRRASSSSSSPPSPPRSSSLSSMSSKSAGRRCASAPNSDAKSMGRLRRDARQASAPSERALPRHLGSARARSDAPPRPLRA